MRFALLLCLVGCGDPADPPHGTYPITRGGTPCLGGGAALQQTIVIGDGAITVTAGTTPQAVTDVRIDPFQRDAETGDPNVWFTLAEEWIAEGVGGRTGTTRYVLWVSDLTLSGHADSTYTGARYLGGPVETCTSTWTIRTTP